MTEIEKNVAMLKLKALGKNLYFYKKEQLAVMQLGVLADTLVRERRLWVRLPLGHAENVLLYCKAY